MRTLGKVMRIFDEHDIEEWELPPLRHFIREKPGYDEWHVLPGQKLLTTLLQSAWMVLRVKASKSSQAQGGPATPLSAFGPRNSHALWQTSQLSPPTSRNTPLDVKNSTTHPRLHPWHSSVSASGPHP